LRFEFATQDRERVERAVAMPAKPNVRLKGQIEYFISPYEQRIFADWFDPKLILTKLQRKVSENAKDVVPAFLVLVGTIYLGDKLYEEESKRHRY
jgi:hypothetical protein